MILLLLTAQPCQHDKGNGLHRMTGVQEYARALVNTR
jgi:hypothetical protein